MKNKKPVFVTVLLVMALVGCIFLLNGINTDRKNTYVYAALPVSGSERGSFVTDIS